MNFGKAKVLFLDIETAPNIVAHWACGYKQTVSPESLIQERFMISAQWSWNGSKIIEGKLSNIKKADDKQLIKTLSKELRKADIIVGHNVKKFDARWIEGRALLNGLPPTGAPFIPTIDTMRLAKQAFALNSYKLDYIAKALGIGQKIKTSYNDWMDVLVNKDMSRAEFLLKYGKEDVSLNRKVFYKLLPFVKLPMNLAALMHGNADFCACGSVKVYVHSYRTTKAGTLYRRFRCEDCGSIHQAEVKMEAR